MHPHSKVEGCTTPSALFTNIQKYFYLIDVFHDFSNLTIFQGVILKWRSENFGIYKTLTGAQKCARSPMDVSFEVSLRKGMDKHPLKD